MATIYSKNKIQKLKNLSELEKTTIDHLNDDCLISIFENLTAVEKLSIEFVSKRWNRISKLSWNNYRSFDVRKILSDRQLMHFNMEKNENSLINLIETVLKRCSKYLNSLHLEAGITHLDYNQCVSKISEYCESITHLDIKDSYLDKKVLSDYVLLDLFIKAENLNSISLHCLSINGICLFRSYNIKDLTIENCFIESKDFLKDFENLKKLTVKYCDNIISKYETIINEIMSPLKKNKQLTHLTIISGALEVNKFIFDDFYIYLSKQKNLSYLKLINVDLNKNLMDSIPTEHLSELIIGNLDDCLGDIKNSFINFKKLESFSCTFKKLKYDHLKKLIKYINENVKKLEITFFDHDLRGFRNLCFNRLKNLERFALNYEVDISSIDRTKIFVEEKDDDSAGSIYGILIDLIDCQNLKNLSLYGFIKYSYFEIIKYYKNLESLEIWSIMSLDLSKVCKILINNLLNLKEIKVIDFYGIEKFIKKASKIKLNRGDKHNLKIKTTLFDMDPSFINRPLIQVYFIEN